MFRRSALLYNEVNWPASDFYIGRIHTINAGSWFGRLKDEDKRNTKRFISSKTCWAPLKLCSAAPYKMLLK